MDTLIFYAIALCTVLLAISSFFDKFAEYSNRSIFHGRPWVNTAFFGKLWFKITFAVFFTATSIYLTKYNSELSDQKAQSAIKSRDTAYRKYLDSSITATKDTTVSTINTLLAKYNLRYDTGRNSMENLIKRTIMPDIPGLDVSSTSNSGIINTTVDSLHYKIILKNTGNCPILVNIKVYVASLCNGNLGCDKTELGLSGYSLSQTLGVNFPVDMHYQNLPSDVYFLILGSYSTVTKSINYPIDVLLEWSMQQNSVGVPIEIKHLNQIENAIKQTLHIPKTAL